MRETQTRSVSSLQARAGHSARGTYPFSRMATRSNSRASSFCRSPRPEFRAPKRRGRRGFPRGALARSQARLRLLEPDVVQVERVVTQAGLILNRKLVDAHSLHAQIRQRDLVGGPTARLRGRAILTAEGIHDDPNRYVTHLHEVHLRGLVCDRGLQGESQIRVGGRVEVPQGNRAARVRQESAVRTVDGDPNVVRATQGLATGVLVVG